MFKPAGFFLKKSTQEMNKLDAEYTAMQHANKESSKQIRNSIQNKSEKFKQEKELRSKNFNSIRNKWQ